MEKDKATEENIALLENLKGIKNRVMVFSGKGGVGKSTIAVNIATVLADKGLQVGLLDVDIHGPNLVKMLGLEQEGVKASERGKIIPVNFSPNLKLISMGFLLTNYDTPVIWRGPLKMKVIQQFLQDVEWGNLDWLIIDSPPGTGDEPLSVAQLIPATSAIVVTTPQQVSVMDSRKAIAFAKQLNLNMLGIIENMAGFVCPNCGKITHLFKENGGLVAANELKVPFLGKVPIDPVIVEAGDTGKPFTISHPESEASKEMHHIVDKIINQMTENP